MNTQRLEITAASADAVRVGEELVITLLASAAIALLAQISVPVGPIPITGQTLGVLGISWALGRVRALNAVALYLAKGASGLPVFAGGTGGAAVLLGPTGGYLLGFLLAALIVGSIADRARAASREKSALRAAAAFILGTAAVYATGLLLLSRVLPDGLLQVGLLPFLPGDAIKVLILIATLPALNRLQA